MKNKKWAVIWSDSAELNKVMSASQSQIEKLRTEINAGQAKLKIPFLEYSTGEKPQSFPLDFEKEALLLENLKVFTHDQIIKEVNKKNIFKPFVALVEGTFVASRDLAEWVRTEHRCLIENNFITSSDLLQNSQRIIDSKDWQIVQEYKDYLEMPQSKTAITLNDEQYLQEVTRTYMGAESEVINYVNRAKPCLKGSYRGGAHHVYFFGNTISPPAIYFPESSIECLPNVSSFKAKSIGVLNFVTNPPYENFPNLIFRPVVLAVPWGSNN
ncbi:hypothetical protein KAT92_04565 [Candidatus Babeliales bacterium]|nr:hypothetical protein [Candidatus Babeliales bacterium]